MNKNELMRFISPIVSIITDLDLLQKVNPGGGKPDKIIISMFCRGVLHNYQW